MRLRGTLTERLQAYFAGHPFEVWRGVQQWRQTPHASLVWAWFADWCGVYETPDTNDPIELARSEGRREAFFALWDLAGMDRNDVLEVQDRALRIGGDDE